MGSSGRRLRYERAGRAQGAFLIRLGDGFSVLALAGRRPDGAVEADLYVREDGIEDWRLAEGLSPLECGEADAGVGAAVLRRVSWLRDSGALLPYERRAGYENLCFAAANMFAEGDPGAGAALGSLREAAAYAYGRGAADGADAR